MILSKFKEKLNNTPHLMTEQTFLNVVEMLETTVTKELLNVLDEYNQEGEPQLNLENGVGTIHIEGPLTYKTEWYQEWLGGTSYESIKEQMDNLTSKGMNTLLLIVDSGGGEAYGMFETGNYLRKVADENNIKILCYVDGLSASAAYGLSCIADEVVANPQADVGSIGVVVRLRNVNEAMQKMGVKDTYVYAGKNKIPYKADGSFTESFVSEVQDKVDTLYEEFTNYVAANRNISVEEVKSTEAGTYLAKDAVEVGLVDSVMTHEEFYTYLADYVQKEKKPEMLKSKFFKMNSEQEKVEMRELEEAKVELSVVTSKLNQEVAVTATLQKEIADLKTALDEAKTQLNTFSEIASKLEADKEALVKMQAEAAEAKRKAELSEVLPQDSVEVTLKALSGVSDEVFNITLSGYKEAQKVKLNSPLFKELGDEGKEVDHGKPDPVKAQIEYQNKQNKNQLK
jgi:signal peptide peptidase SppA